MDIKFEWALRDSDFPDGPTYIPSAPYEGCAGWDLEAVCLEPIKIPYLEMRRVYLGYAVHIPEGYCGILTGRSGMAMRYGLVCFNGIGVIDSGFSGQLSIMLINYHEDLMPVDICCGARVAQLIIVPCIGPKAKGIRGKNGYGSSGGLDIVEER